MIGSLQATQPMAGDDRYSVSQEPFSVLTFPPPTPPLIGFSRLPMYSFIPRLVSDWTMPTNHHRSPPLYAVFHISTTRKRRDVPTDLLTRSNCPIKPTYLANAHPVGLSLREQLLESGVIPMSDHDWRMDVVIAPDEVLIREEGVKANEEAS